MLVKIISKFNCQSFPLDETAIEVPQEVLDLIGVKYCFDVENNRVIDYDNSEDLRIAKLEELRVLRNPLLQSFDIYKSNVNYGIETDNNREEIIAWYNAILDLDEKAINNPPSDIRRYM